MSREAPASRAVGPVHLATSVRSERLISAGRVTLAAISLFAIWLDPSEPARFAPVAYTLLGGYVLYAAALAAWFARAESFPRRVAITTHVFDLALFTVVQYFTEGASSPFFVYFVFSLLCAALRWQARGVRWTAAGALTAYLGLGLLAGLVIGEPPFELNRFIIRGTYLGVAAILLGYLAAFDERRRREIAGLAAWPNLLASSGLPPVREILAHAGRVLGARRVVMVWEPREEPGLFLASWTAGSFEQTRDPAEHLAALVAAPLADANFFCSDAGTASPMVIRRDPTGSLTPWSGPPIADGLRRRFDMRAVLSVLVGGECFTGRLFALDGPRLTADHLVLADVVARQVAASLDHFYLGEQIRDSAVLQDRLGLARDLHDGVLQSLAAVDVALETLKQRPEQPERSRGEIARLQQVVATEQRDLRAFIRELSALSGDTERPVDLARSLGELAERVGREWGVRVEAAVADAGALPAPQARQVYLMVREALVNAVKHSGGATFQVRLATADGELRATIVDDGKGFDFVGRLAHRELAAASLGPRSLRERLEALGGWLAIDSSPRGSAVELTIPVGAAAPDAR